MDSIESAIVLGIPVIIRNVKENMDPALLPVLKKVVVEKGIIVIVTLGMGILS